MSESGYIHGTTPAEQDRLALLNRLTNPAFLEFLNLRGDECVLEVGSGLGILAGEVAARLRTGSVTGAELSAEQLAAAARYAPNVRFVRADAMALPFCDASFDVVYCRYLLEHVPAPERVLCEIRRVLRPGGRALAQENNILVNVFFPECPSWDSVWRAFVELQADLGGDALIGRRLLPLFRQAGFQQVELSIQPEVHWAGMSSFVPWVTNLQGNVLSGRETLIRRGFATENEIEAALAELDSLKECEEGAAYFYWNRAVTVR